MKQELFIHVGMHKTATKLMQQRIFPGLEGITQLTKPYDGYPELKSALNRLCYEDESLYEPQEVIRILADEKSERVILSDEDLCGRPIGFGGCINRSVIAHRLSSSFPDAKIILVIRGQASMIMSTYNQYVKGPSKGFLPVKAAVTKGGYNPRDLYIHMNTFMYYELVSLYKNLFKNVLVVLYEDIQAAPQRVIGQIESFTGSRLKEDIRTSDRVHGTPPGRQMQTLRFVNAWRRVFGMNAFTKVALRLYRSAYLPLKKPEPEIQTIGRMIEGYYDANNRRLHEVFPELGIDRYPDAYPL